MTARKRVAAAAPSPTPAVPTRLMSMPEVAEVLSCSRTHIYSLIAQGDLPVVEIGGAGTRSKTRVRASDVEAFIAARTRHPRADPRTVPA